MDRGPINVYTKGNAVKLDQLIPTNQLLKIDINRSAPAHPHGINSSPSREGIDRQNKPD
jgi:hypothetical protein|uniref:Uncharacterized protein n=1 Tax=Picea glauca TaxID=3330 RepID=A0A101LVV8_PICGL|nr:hypothetical protein ABT39_MTgene1796 [Picea glauca]QHR86347.1 hypothetical protein Q903MT_gene346 [Picea sitchensis]